MRRVVRSCLALRSPDGTFTTNPTGNTVLGHHHVIIAIGTAEDFARLVEPSSRTPDPMLAPTTHVLLDLDGTISDSSPGIGRSLTHAFTECGYPAPDETTIRDMIGPPFELSFPKHGIHVDDVEQVINVYRDRYEDVGLFENEVYDGVHEMLDALSSAGHTISLATAKPQDTAVRIIEHFGLTEYFARQVGATHEIGVGRRTKGEVITHAARTARRRARTIGSRSTTSS